jgi:hypothetical protein
LPKLTWLVPGENWKVIVRVRSQLERRLDQREVQLRDAVVLLVVALLHHVREL